MRLATLASNSAATNYRVDRNAGISRLSNISFNSVKRRALMCLTSGGCVTLFDAVEVSAVIDVIAKHLINHLSAVPTHAVELLKVAKDNEFLFPDLKAFRLSSDNRARGPSQGSSNAPNTQSLHWLWAVASRASFRSPERNRCEAFRASSVSCPGMEVQIIDDDGQPLPPGSVGKVRLRSSGMVSGYVNDAAETGSHISRWLALSGRSRGIYPCR